MWSLYDRLIGGIPPGLRVEDYNMGAVWTCVTAGGNTGLGSSLPGHAPSSILGGSLLDMELRELAALVKSWNFLEASFGLVAINAFYNSWEKVNALPGFERPDDMRDNYGSRIAKQAFLAFGQEVSAKKVAVVGRFPKMEVQLEPICDLTVLERNPGPGDLPDSACEYLLPEQDYVFITGTTLINKTLPRLLQLCSGAKTCLVGPSVPMSEIFFEYGADNLSGFVVTENELMRDIVSRAGQTPVFRAGRMVSVNKGG